MEQIYDFEQANPLVLNENMLRQKMEKRKLNHQMALLVVSGILLQVVVILFGCMTLPVYPVIAVMCAGYVVFSVTGSSVLAIVYARKGGLRI